MSDIWLFGRFNDLPTEIRLLIWSYHFDSYFTSPHIHTINGGFLSWDTGQLEPLSSLRSIISRGRLLKGLADRYDWRTRDVPILQWKTVIRDLSPFSGKIYSAHRGSMATWPKIQPLINREAFNAAQACCKRYDVIDLWLDSSTLNVSQPCLVDVTSDLFRIDPGIAKMMGGLDDAAWLARIRRLAIGPFETRGHFDVVSILRILEHTGDLDEVYILLSPETTRSQARHLGTRRHIDGIGLSLVEVSVEGQLDSRAKEPGSPLSDSADATDDLDYATTIRRIVQELGLRCSSAGIVYGCLEP